MAPISVYANIIERCMPMTVTLAILCGVDGVKRTIRTMIVLVEVGIMTLLIGFVRNLKALRFLEEGSPR